MNDISPEEISPSQIKAEPDLCNEEKDDESNDHDKESIATSLENSNDDFIIVPANDNHKPKNKPLSWTENFQCDFCLKYFKNKQGLSRHVQSHIDPAIPWKCESCNFQTKSVSKLCAHRSSAHPIKGTLISNAIKEHAKVKGRSVVEKASPENEEKAGTKEYICFCGSKFQHARSLCAHKK